MLRDKNLIPLSHDHQRALALCVRIDRAQPILEANLPVWRTEIQQFYDREIEVHFAAEEAILFPSASQFGELIPLVEELVRDHCALRTMINQAQMGTMSAESLAAFGQMLSMHIRKEERQLFEGMQRLMSADEPLNLGRLLEVALQRAGQLCALPNETTKLLPKL